MKKRIVSIFIAAVMLITIIPSNAMSVKETLYHRYVENGDTADFWTVIGARASGYVMKTTAKLEDCVTALDIAKLLLMRKASNMIAGDVSEALVACVRENGSIETEADDVAGEQCASTQAFCILALETAKADYNRKAAIDYLFSQQCENGGLGYYSYDDVSTSCWSMIAYMMSGVPGYDRQAISLMEYISSSVQDNLVYEYGEANFWSTAAYIWYLEASQSQLVFDVYDAFMETFFDGSEFTVTYQPEQGIVALGCYYDGCIFINMRDGTTGTQVKKITSTKKPNISKTPQIQQPDPTPEDEPTEDTKTFTDIADCSEKEAIEKLYGMGYVGGDIKGNFRPNDNMTRAEALQLFYAVSGKTTEYKGGFTDVNADSWYAAAVQYCSDAGIAGGYKEKMRPNDFITGTEFALICERTGYTVGTELSENVTRAQAAYVVSQNIK